MKSFFLSLLITTLLSSIAISQPVVGVYSFYFDKEIDYSLIQGFSDESKNMIRRMVEAPEFELEPMVDDFHEYFFTSAAPLLPFKISSEEEMLASAIYQILENHYKYENTDQHKTADGYMPLGKHFDDSFLELVPNQTVDGLMSIEVKFFVRKNMYKTVIQAQVSATVWNKDGKKAWNYTEFGISEMGFTAVSGIVVSKQDEVIPMFESALSNLKEKMTGNIGNRSKNATKKL